METTGNHPSPPPTARNDNKNTIAEILNFKSFESETPPKK
jgi:hypothetical protein